MGPASSLAKCLPVRPAPRCRRGGSGAGQLPAASRAVPRGRALVSAWYLAAAARGRVHAGPGRRGSGRAPQCRDESLEAGLARKTVSERTAPARDELTARERQLAWRPPGPTRGPEDRRGALAQRDPARQLAQSRRFTGRRPRPQPGSGGPRLRRRGQPARGHPPAATAGPARRHHLPTRPPSGHCCAAGRRSVPPPCGW